MRQRLQQVGVRAAAKRFWIGRNKRDRLRQGSADAHEQAQHRTSVADIDSSLWRHAQRTAGTTNEEVRSAAAPPPDAHPPDAHKGHPYMSRRPHPRPDRTLIHIIGGWGGACPYVGMPLVGIRGVAPGLVIRVRLYFRVGIRGAAPGLVIRVRLYFRVGIRGVGPGLVIRVRLYLRPQLVAGAQQHLRIIADGRGVDDTLSLCKAGRENVA